MHRIRYAPARTYGQELDDAAYLPSPKPPAASGAMRIRIQVQFSPDPHRTMHLLVISYL